MYHHNIIWSSLYSTENACKIILKNGNIYTERQKDSLEALTVLCVECIMIVRMTLCSLDWVSVLCVATCVNKVTYAGCVYQVHNYYYHTLFKF